MRPRVRRPHEGIQPAQQLVPPPQSRRWFPDGLEKRGQLRPKDLVLRLLRARVLTAGVPAKFDTAKFDTAKFDTAKFDTAKIDTAKIDAAKIDTAKFDAAKIDAAHGRLVAVSPAVARRVPAFSVPAFSVRAGSVLRLAGRAPGGAILLGGLAVRSRGLGAVAPRASACRHRPSLADQHRHNDPRDPRAAPAAIHTKVASTGPAYKGHRAVRSQIATQRAEGHFSLPDVRRSYRVTPVAVEPAADEC